MKMNVIFPYITINFQTGYVYFWNFIDDGFFGKLYIVQFYN